MSLTEKKLELAIRWLNDIKSVGSATSVLATAALSEIEALDNQFPLGGVIDSASAHAAHECPTCGANLDYWGGKASCPNDDCNFERLMTSEELEE